MSMYKYFGVDVSEHNGNIDWKKAKEDGCVEFAMIRAGYGPKGTMDAKLERNIDGCEVNNIPYGLYWFSYAKNEFDVSREADHLLNIAGRCEGTLPLAMDWEYDSMKGIPEERWKKLLPIWHKKFVKCVNDDGYDGMVYMNPDLFQRAYIAAGTPLTVPLWLAHWGVTKPAYDNIMWQYGAMKVPGIGIADVNWATSYTIYGGMPDEKFIASEVGLAPVTIQYLKQYRYGDELIRKLAAALRR